MIRIEETVTVGGEPREVLDYLADFGNLPRWDPGIADATRTDGAGPLAVGARFEVVARFLGRRVPMRYRMTRYDPAAGKAELVGESSTLVATDRIEVTKTEGGTRVRWQADFAMRGPLRLSEPLMRPLFERLGRATMAGLVSTLGRRSQAALRT